MSEGDGNDEDLLDSLASSDRNERATALIQLSERSAAHLARAEAHLEDPDELVVVAACLACWRFGRRDLPFERCFAALDSKDENVAATAAFALSTLGDDVVPILAAGIARDDPHATSLLRVLGDIGSDAARAVVDAAVGSRDEGIVEAASAVIEDWDE